MRILCAFLVLGLSVRLSSVLPVGELAYPTPSPYFNWTREFSLDFAHFAVDHAAAAYSKNPQECLRKHQAELVKRVAVPCDRVWDECWAFVSLSDEWIVVAFRGTVSHIQLTIEILEDVILPKVSFPAGGAVVHYFNTAFETVWLELNDTLSSLKRKHPDRKVLFTGHSLGGALASLASTLFAFSNADLVDAQDIQLVTFGQPRVGNMDYAMAHDSLVPNSWRIVHAKDMVAHIPNCYISLLTRTCASYYNHATYHHGTEIWFPKDMSQDAMFRICTGKPTNEDSECSDGYYYDMNITDHLIYFERHISDYGRLGCQDPLEKRLLRDNRTPKFLES